MEGWKKARVHNERAIGQDENMMPYDYNTRRVRRHPISLHGPVGASDETDMDTNHGALSQGLALNLTESPHLFDGMLRGLGLLLSRRAERRYQTNMHEAAVLVPNPKRVASNSGMG